MDYKAAFKQLKSGKLSPVYVCYGTEAYLMNEFIRRLEERCMAPEHAEFGMSKYDLTQSPIQEVIDDAETVPFMVPVKLIIARNALFLTGSKDSSKVEHQLDRLQQYLDAPLESTIIVLLVEAEKMDERKKIVKLLKERGQVVDFQALRDQDLRIWIEQKFEQAQCSIDSEAVDALLMTAGTDLQHLLAEIQKLVLYAGSGGTITVQTIEALVPRTMEQNVFLLIEELVKRRTDRALSMFYDLLKQKEEPIKILALMAQQFRLLLQVKQLRQSGYSDQQMASRIGVHPYRVKLAGEQAGKYSEKALTNLLSHISQLDYEMKTGQVDKALGLELFILKTAG
ncbi:DNA polymerase III subunit delta [Marinicrinis lubricantis]|uniref:DNA polymerase III subunit delta n=1 Tax=Marinicrinis lubricantis TaxID=2086470 RepID=A0ABW1IV63_9BACL